MEIKKTRECSIVLDNKELKLLENILEKYNLIVDSEDNVRECVLAEDMLKEIRR